MASRSAIKTNNIWVAAGDGDLERVQVSCGTNHDEFEFS